MSDIVLTDDETDIKSMPAGTWLTIAESTGLFGGVTFDARSADGKVERKWSGLNGDAERRKWLADRLLELVRNSGLALNARIARILQKSGPDGVLHEISLIDSSYAKRLYFQRLLDTASLDSGTLARLIQQAGREMHSAYDLATVLVAGVLPRLNARDDTARLAYLQAVKGINSDYDRHRALSALIKAGPLTPAAVGQVLDAAQSIRSDYDRASVLTDVVQSNDISGHRDAFLAALDTIQSDYDRRRVLTALLNHGAPTPAVLSIVYTASQRTRSDHDLAGLLLDAVHRAMLDATLRPMFFHAVAQLKSDFEKGRVLSAVAADQRIESQTLVEVLQAAAQIHSSHERATLLLTLAAQHKLQGPARDAYLAAARTIPSQYDQDRALAALARAEMR